MALLACHECDTLQTLPPVPPGACARCPCCGARLYTRHRGGLDTPLALFLAALVLFLITNGFPLLELTLQGRSQVVSLSGAAWALQTEGMPWLALVVWICSVLAPGLVIVCTLYVLAAVRFSWRLPLLRPLLRTLSRVQPWGMLDVFMLGMLVAVVKLSDMAEIVIGVGLYAFVPLLVLTISATSTLEPRALWERLGTP